MHPAGRQGWLEYCKSDAGRPLTHIKGEWCFQLGVVQKRRHTILNFFWPTLSVVTLIITEALVLLSQNPSPAPPKGDPIAEFFQNFISSRPKN